MSEVNLQAAQELVSKLCNGTLTSIEADSLAKILEYSKEACDLYIRLMHLHHSLEYGVNVDAEALDSEGLGKLSAALALALAGVGTSGDHGSEEQGKGPQGAAFNLTLANSGQDASVVKSAGISTRVATSVTSSLTKYLPKDMSLAVLASLLLVAITSVLWVTIPIGKRGKPHEVVLTDALPAPANNPAQVVWASLDCKLANASSDLIEGAFLVDGQTIQIEKGEVKLHFKQGARVTLWGPSTFTVKSLNSGILVTGSLTAEVTEDARGFTVDVPNGKVVDLGTKFGVVVDDFGVAKVGVFDGEVITYQGQEQGVGSKVESLTMGHGLQWDSTASQRFLIDRTPMPHTNDPAEAALFERRLSNSSPILVDDFNDGSLDPDKWSILGSVEEKDGYLQLGGDKSRGVNRGNVPYLLTKLQYDPSQGAIVVTGNVTFSTPLNPNSGALSILTRAEDRRGTFPRLDYSYLATGVRSTFWPMTTELGETLRILVRPSSASANVGLLGENFEASIKSSEWTFQLVDDGMNLSLTVVQLDDPKVRKTVCCRSLFGGKSNFIAIEGDPIAVIRVDDLKIFQLENDPWPGTL